MNTNNKQIEPFCIYPYNCSMQKLNQNQIENIFSYCNNHVAIIVFMRHVRIHIDD